MLNKYFHLGHVFILLLLAGSLFSIVPVVNVAYAQDSEPGKSGYFLLDFKCSGGVIPGGRDGEERCNFKDFMTLINRIITFLLYFALVLATISFIYAGFLLITSGGNEAKLKKAKDIFWKVIVGFFFAFLAFMIVQFVMQAFGVDEERGYTMLEQTNN